MLNVADLEKLHDFKQIESLRRSPEIEDNELLQAAYALLVQQHRLEPYRPKLYPLLSGAIPLARKGFFPWGALPLPEPHAQLGAFLSQLEDPELRQIALEMIPFQAATLDHAHKPVVSLLRQEGIGSLQNLEKSNLNFFGGTPPQKSECFQFAEHTLGMISRRDETTTVVCIGSGCKSGMGAFLSHDAGILNFGPQEQPLGNCSGFGIAGKAQKLDIHEDKQEFALSFHCRLAAASRRQTNFFNLNDSGFSGLWIQSKMSGNLKNMTIQCQFEGIVPFNTLSFAFFGKGEKCVVSGSHQLKPRSLDRYLGPPQSIQFLGKEGVIEVDALEGLADMQVIPLAGDASFWGADFLVGYTLASPSIAFSARKG